MSAADTIVYCVGLAVVMFVMILAMVPFLAAAMVVAERMGLWIDARLRGRRP